METIKCTKCKEFKPATKEYFYVSRNNKTGFQAWCKDCTRTPEQIEKRRIAIARWQKNNPKKVRQYYNTFKILNKEKIHQTIYKWTRENKDANLAIQSKYQSKIPPAVYAIKYENTVIYIGSSNQPLRRLNVHFSTIKTTTNIGKVNKLHSFYGYDKSKFSYEIIEEVDVDKLLERESYWEEHFDAKGNYRRIFGKLESVKSMLIRLGYL